MGKHAAAAGASAHPLVAAALAHRSPDAPRRAHRDDVGGLGWPAPPAPGDGGLGWPGGDPGDTTADEPREPEPAEDSSRVWWRRLFGSRAA